VKYLYRCPQAAAYSAPRRSAGAEIGWFAEGGTGAAVGALGGPVGVGTGAAIGAGAGAITGAVTSPSKVDLGRRAWER
jgi:hypothetical protein